MRAGEGGRVRLCSPVRQDELGSLCRSQQQRRQRRLQQRLSVLTFAGADHSVLLAFRASVAFVR